ncbi:uncharacterized protein LOC107274086 isoform X2 [Cephus cinctus]|nr:uncharacterized protein LOC107274086 isoform X2 [Cephus cinctus]XP_015608330.1 uncharacterized protein LOC107274086 isoform X2 [Cephus cinctus]
MEQHAVDGQAAEVARLQNEKTVQQNVHIVNTEAVTIVEEVEIDNVTTAIDTHSTATINVEPAGLLESTDAVLDFDNEATIEVIVGSDEGAFESLNPGTSHSVEPNAPQLSSTPTNAVTDSAQEIHVNNVPVKKDGDTGEIVKSENVTLEVAVQKTVRDVSNELKGDVENIDSELKTSNHMLKVDTSNNEGELDSDKIMLTERKNVLCNNESISEYSALCHVEDSSSVKELKEKEESLVIDQDISSDCVNQNCEPNEQFEYSSTSMKSAGPDSVTMLSTNSKQDSTVSPLVSKDASSTNDLTDRYVTENSAHSDICVHVSSQDTQVFDDSLQEKSNLIIREDNSNHANDKDNFGLVIYEENAKGETISMEMLTESEVINNTRTDDDECHLSSVSLVKIEFVTDHDITTSGNEAITVTSVETPSIDNQEESHDLLVMLDKDDYTVKEVSTDNHFIASIKPVVQSHSKNVKDTLYSKSKNDVESTIVKKQRSVVQDIVDEWTDENQEDSVDDQKQQSSFGQDSVEIELKTLLEDEKNKKTFEHNKELLSRKEDEQQIVTGPLAGSNNTLNVSNKSNEQTKSKNIMILSIENEHSEMGRDSGKTETKNIPNKEALNKIPQQVHGNLSKRLLQDKQVLLKNKVSTPKAGVKLLGRPLTSQIASTAEVTEVLKERLREKQKNLEMPQRPDIFFVKKLTQRLSSKLSASSANPLPRLIPLPQKAACPNDEVCETKIATTSTTPDKSKTGNTDNKELLAILEGDVDPDWSNLKPPVLIAEDKPTSTKAHHNTPPKLDPLIERELALKQLLELPSVPSTKKTNAKKKKTVQLDTSNNDKQTPKVSAANSENTNSEPLQKDVSLKDPPSAYEESPESVGKNISQIEQATVSTQDVRLDESRSGRKRKPTERAREHEQNTSKRQKIYKGKIAVKSPQPTENVVVHASQREEEEEVKTPEGTHDQSTEIEESQKTNESLTKSVSGKQVVNKADVTPSKVLTTYSSRSKQSLAKKGPQPIAKRKMAVKKLLRRKMQTNKKAVNLKSKLLVSTKSAGKSQKSVSEVSPGDTKPKKKVINEIDRLLQDEGVVNLLYDVEQPDKKRLVPITKSQTKVMDIQKVQRELKIRTKLVRNAVLRLRTSNVSNVKVSPRSKRGSVVRSSQNSLGEEKSSDQIRSPRLAASAANEFVFPAKIRNAADASVIVRRHSSSSFSSASYSPRVSIDGPEKQTLLDGSKDKKSIVEETGAHILRSNKRRYSQDEKTKQSGDSKKTKKKVAAKSESEKFASKAIVDLEVAVADDKPTVATRSNKRIEAKKAEKTSSKMIELVDIDEGSNSSSFSKIVTRSNGASAGKAVTKSKRGVKGKVTFARGAEADRWEETPKEEDELSACLAEVATALSDVTGMSGRSESAIINRKHKANANLTKTTDIDGGKKAKIDGESSFSNKEINVRRHGNLVQLILTPSSSTKIRNGITLQVMREFREILSILKKDDECRVVLLTSTGTSFCEGLELTNILQVDKEKRLMHAQEMANGVKSFIKSLATFNKPIVAGVQGAAVGLGVTMLPLFDLVIASDKATFSTPYGKLGQIAEGAAIFTLSHTLGSAFTSELLLGGRTFTASEALRAGLVTRVLWPDRFQDELLPSLRAMSEQSSQSMEATKALLRNSHRKELDAALESESYLLVQHWCSSECQRAIKSYIDEKVQ